MMKFLLGSLLLLPISVSAQSFTLTSQYTHHTYRIDSQAIGYAPKQGYPVLYLLDGHHYFPAAATSAPTVLNNQRYNNVTPMLIIGISYTNNSQQQRAKDDTPAEYVSQHSDTDYGGAAAFAQFLQQELMPQIAQSYPIDTKRQALFGHSFGGLFASYQLATNSTRYQYYFLSSPSLWFGEQRIFHYFNQPIDGDVKVYMSVGEYEQAAPNDARRRQRDMIGNAQKLNALLQQQGIVSELTIFPDEHHGSVAYPALHRTLKILRQAWQPENLRQANDHST